MWGNRAFNGDTSLKNLENKIKSFWWNNIHYLQIKFNIKSELQRSGIYHINARNPWQEMIKYNWLSQGWQVQTRNVFEFSKSLPDSHTEIKYVRKLLQNYFDELSIYILHDKKAGMWE